MTPADTNATPLPRHRRRGRRLLYALIGFVVCVLVVDSLIGERGLFETIRARRQHGKLQTEIDGVRLENARLREQARQLREDPATIEAIARRELGLIKPGEILFIIKDLPQTQDPPGHPGHTDK